MASPAFSLCVYCGSRPGADPAFATAAAQVGQWIGQHGGRLVYGGGHNGLMGTVADACLEAGGQVVGIIPKTMVEREWAHVGCTELIVVDSMHERKRLMMERADAFIALPGGIGTFEEFFEVWCWRHLGFHDKPVGLLNTNGYYGGLLQFLKQPIEQGFFGGPQMGMVEVDTEPAPLLKKLVELAGFTASPHSALI